MLPTEYDAIVVGGGFYGCSLALALAPDFHRILVLEQEPELLTRASYANQARVHNGYHYPRSLLTAIRSAANYPTFTEEFRQCIDRQSLHTYAIARGGSKVSAYQFRKFCQQVNIPHRPPPASLAKLFNPALIEEVFAVEESTFDAVRLRALITARLESMDVEVLCNRTVDTVTPDPIRGLCVRLADQAELWAPYVFNCTYSQINQLLARSSLSRLPLKHELAELALIEVPEPLAQTGITVMDGPFFSTIPFSGGLHTLTHVTYTPHDAWSDAADTAPRAPVSRRPSRNLFMLKDAQRYLPILREARYVDSLFETKTVLLRNEVDDGRPILCYRHPEAAGLFVILGAKIDNIYDIIQAITSERLERRSAYVS